MRVFYQDTNTDPALNLALEEVLMDRALEDLFWLWRDDPSVIVGRNQNTIREINPDYVGETGIPVVRRLSGGGAVYHDLGNLCFTYIQLGGDAHKGDHAHFARPVVGALNRLGIPAMMQGRNDIAVEGRKISGNAQYARKGRICHHGTLLVDVDVAAMQSALRPDIATIKGRGIESVPARVRNLSVYRPDLTAPTLAALLTEDLLIGQHAQPFAIPQAIWDAANQIADARYRTWAWNYGESPPYDYQKTGHFRGGSVEVRLQVEDGMIQSVHLYGDFMATEDLSALTQALRGVPHRREDIHAVLVKMDAGRRLGSVSTEELLTVF